MRTIWKWPLLTAGSTSFNLTMPKGAKILCVQTQAEIPCLWAEVEQTDENEERTFEIFGTGHRLTVGADVYIGTFQVQGGAFVFHVYEQRK